MCADDYSDMEKSGQISLWHTQVAIKKWTNPPTPCTMLENDVKKSIQFVLFSGDPQHCSGGAGVQRGGVLGWYICKIHVF